MSERGNETEKIGNISCSGLYQLILQKQKSQSTCRVRKHGESYKYEGGNSMNNFMPLCQTLGAWIQYFLLLSGMMMSGVTKEKRFYF